MRAYLANHKKEFVAIDKGAECNFCMEKVNPIEDGLTVKFVFLRVRKSGRNTLVLITKVLDMPPMGSDMTV